MEAHLRHAARRLVGVRRTQTAVVAEERRRLLPRLVHTDESASMLQLQEIQERKEELYDLISLTENSLRTDSRNRRLLRSLSSQIVPRPHDSQWCFMRAAKRRSDVIRPVGIVAGLCLGFASILLLKALEETSQAILKEQQEEKAAKEKEVALV